MLAVSLCSEASAQKQHLRYAVSDVYAKPPSDFSLLLKCALSDMGAGDCPVRCSVTGTQLHLVLITNVNTSNKWRNSVSLLRTVKHVKT